MMFIAYINATFSPSTYKSLKSIFPFSNFRAWLPGKDLLPFKKYQQKFRATSQRQRPGLSEAVWEIEEDPDLQLSEHGSLLKKLLKSGKKVCNSFFTIHFNFSINTNRKLALSSQKKRLRQNLPHLLKNHPNHLLYVL